MFLCKNSSVHMSVRIILGFLNPPFFKIRTSENKNKEHIDSNSYLIWSYNHQWFIPQIGSNIWINCRFFLLDLKKKGKWLNILSFLWKISNLIWSMCYCWLIIHIAFRVHTHWRIAEDNFEAKFKQVRSSCKNDWIFCHSLCWRKDWLSNFFHSWCRQISFGYFLVNIQRCK